MSSFGALYVGSSGLQTGQNALNATAHNLANVGTKGYTRQQVYLADREHNTVGASSVSMMQAGIGVSFGQARQVRDYFLDKYYRTEAGRHAFYNTAYTTSNEIEKLFGEMEGVAFQNSLSELYNSFEELDKIPDDTNNQDLVVLKANEFLERSKDIYNGLKQYQLDINEKVTDMVQRINNIGKSIAELNREIQRIESNGLERANDLRDERNQLIDELSEYGKIEFDENFRGMINIKFEDEPFVNDTFIYKMGTYRNDVSGFIMPIWPNLSDLEAGVVQEVFKLNIPIATNIDTDIGSLKAYVLARGDKVSKYYDIEGQGVEEYNNSLASFSPIMNAQAHLDQLIHNIVTKVNEVLSPTTQITADDGTVYRVWDEVNGRYGSNGEGPGEELITRNSVSRYTKKTLTVGGETKDYYVFNEEVMNDRSTLYTLENLKMNEKLLKDETLLPHLNVNGSVSYEMTDELVKIFSTSFLTLNPNDTTPLTIEEYYENMTDLFATRGSAFSNKALTVSGTVEAIYNKRQEVVGVSSDEELSNMIKFQNAFNASSRYINVINEMIEHLILHLG